MSGSIFTQNDEDLLDFTIKTRTKIVTNLTREKDVPEDSDDKRILIQALDGIDKQILAKTKIRSDDQNQKTQQQTAEIIAELLLSTNKVLMQAPTDNSSKLLNDQIQPEKIVEGQLDIGTIEIDPKDILTQP